MQLLQRTEKAMHQVGVQIWYIRLAQKQKKEEWGSVDSVGT